MLSDRDNRVFLRLVHILCNTEPKAETKPIRRWLFRFGYYLIDIEQKVVFH
jgi:hypothetical protein